MTTCCTWCVIITTDHSEGIKFQENRKTKHNSFSDCSIHEWSNLLESYDGRVTIYPQTTCFFVAGQELPTRLELDTFRLPNTNAVSFADPGNNLVNLTQNLCIALVQIFLLVFILIARRSIVILNILPHNQNTFESHVELIVGCDLGQCLLIKKCPLVWTQIGPTLKQLFEADIFGKHG